jgi:hypothetical protein
MEFPRPQTRALPVSPVIPSTETISEMEDIREALFQAKKMGRCGTHFRKSKKCLVQGMPLESDGECLSKLGS